MAMCVYTESGTGIETVCLCVCVCVYVSVCVCVCVSIYHHGTPNIFRHMQLAKYLTLWHSHTLLSYDVPALQ